MAENVTLAPVTSFTNDSSAVATVNANSQLIESAFADCLSLTGGSPNQMQAVLDMNSFNIINLPSPATVNSPARLVDVVSNPTIQVPTVGTSGSTVPLLNGINTWSAVNTHTANDIFTGIPAFNGGFTITTSGLTAGIVENQSFTGTISAFSGNFHNVSSDNATITGAGAFLIPWNWNYSFGGAAMQGNRAMFNLAATYTAADNNVTSSPNYVTFTPSMVVNAGDNGSGGSPRGAFFVANPVLRASNATNLFALCGYEIDILASGTTSVTYKSILSLVALTGDTVQGTSTDSALVISNTGGPAPVGFKNVIDIGVNNGNLPFNASSTIIRTNGGGTATNGIDLSSTTFTGSSFKSSGFSVTGAGGVSCASFATTGSAGTLTGTATTAGGFSTPGISMGSSGFGVYFGSGAPTISATQGSIYIRSDGSSSSTRLYVNSSGSTTWVAVTTAS